MTRQKTQFNEYNLRVDLCEIEVGEPSLIVGVYRYKGAKMTEEIKHQLQARHKCSREAMRRVNLLLEQEDALDDALSARANYLSALIDYKQRVRRNEVLLENGLPVESRYQAEQPSFLTLRAPYGPSFPYAWKRFEFKRAAVGFVFKSTWPDGIFLAEAPDDQEAARLLPGEEGTMSTEDLRNLFERDSEEGTGSA